MQYTPLGTTGLKVSRIWLGMMSYGSSAWRDWVLDEDDAEPFVTRALELGINTFDTADMYSRGMSEEVTGRLVLRHARREEVVLATKLYFPISDHANAGGLSRKHVLEGIDAALSRLGTDYVDVLQIHRFDPETPVEETMEALDDVVRAGKVLYLGASSMQAWEFAKLQRVASVGGWTPFVSMQPHYNLLYREEEREMLPQCRDMGVGVVPWSPLARGRLARPPDRRDATTRGQSDALGDRLYGGGDDPIIDAVAALAADHDVSMAQVALAWLLHRGVTAPIVGATKLDHLEDAAGAVDLELSADDVQRVEEHYRPREAYVHR